MIRRGLVAAYIDGYVIACGGNIIINIFINFTKWKKNKLKERKLSKILLLNF